jgi:hypothetical protein
MTKWLLFAAPALVWAQIQVGAGSTVITPDLAAHGPVYLAGFGNNRVATGVHDELYARCIAFQVSRNPIVFCGLDSIGLFLDDVEKIRARIKGRAIIASLHDHQAPDTMGLWGPSKDSSGINEPYNTLVVDRTVEAAQAAIASLKPARIKIAKTADAELDTFIQDTRPPVQHDSEAVILVAEDLSGKPIATLLNWANHPETLGSKNTLVTADYSGYLRHHLEKQIGGAAVFINGAVGGMQSPLGANLPHAASSFERAEHIGRRVAELAARAVSEARHVEINRVIFRETTLQIPLANPGFQAAAAAGLFRGRKPVSPGGTSNTTVGFVRFADGDSPVLEIAAIPGEMYPELSVGGAMRYDGADFPEASLETPVKQQMKAPFRMLFGLANDEIGYIIPKAEWDGKEPWLQNSARRWYGEVNSVGPEAGPMINAAFATLVREQ